MQLYRAEANYKVFSEKKFNCSIWIFRRKFLLKTEEERLVKKIAFALYKTYCPKGGSGLFTVEDLFHYGIIGLLKAKKNFKKKRASRLMPMPPSGFMVKSWMP